jgi:hypothetical protein
MCRIALAACALALLSPTSAFAAKDAEVSIMDDQLLLNATSREAVDAEMQRFKRLGVDRLRVSAFWDQIAPKPGRRNKPNFDASDGQSPRYHFAQLDRVVVSAHVTGLKVLISITTPAPLWATGDPGKHDRQWKPKPSEFAQFAAAIAKRYGPVADQFAALNEPNQPGWLQPQTDGKGPFAPHHYRKLVRAAFPQIRAADPSATILVGELASSGSKSRGPDSSIRPLAFMRAFGCVSRSFRPVRSGRCKGFKPARADAIGHHPYEFFRHPSKPSPHRDDAAIGDGARLLRFLDRLVGAGGLTSARGGKLDLHYTEFGYQTDPPDPYAGIPLKRQARWLQDAAYVAWRTPRVRGLNQFRLTDGPILPGGGFAAYREFQSGLMFRNRKLKPAYAAFPRPFVKTKRGFWGQVRPGGRRTVTLEKRSGGRWKRVVKLQTDANGYWQRRGKSRGQWRYRSAGGTSAVLRVG